jgi:hypothetical protein
LKNAALDIEDEPENLLRFCLRVTLLNKNKKYSMDVSLNESEEIFLRLD